MEKELTLREKFILLSYHPEKGKAVTISSYYPYGIAGSVLLELAEKRKIEIKNKRILLIDSKATGDQILDLVISRMANTRRKLKTTTWINKLARHGIKKQISLDALNKLIDKKILQKQEARALLIFSYNKYPARDSKPRKEILKNIHDVVLKKHLGSKDTYLLIGLIGATRMTGKFFERSERRKARKQVREILKSNEIARALDETVAAIQTAIFASVAASAAVSAANASH